MTNDLPDIGLVMEKVKNSPVTVKLCPRCLKNYFTPYRDAFYVEHVSPPFGALSRRDNKTYICSECGQQEAVEDSGLLKKWDEHKYWEG